MLYKSLSGGPITFRLQVKLHVCPIMWPLFFSRPLLRDRLGQCKNLIK